MKEESAFTNQHLPRAAVMLVAGLLAAMMLVSVTVFSPAFARETSSRSAVQVQAIRIPDKAYRVAMFAYKHNWNPPRHYRGNYKYHNDYHNLPNGHEHYLAYHIDPKGVVSQERIVINTQTKGWWYSPNKYRTFRYVGELDNN